MMTDAGLTTIHDIKCLPEYFDAVLMQRKTFELRKDDRRYMVGDAVILREWEDGSYTGRMRLPGP